MFKILSLLISFYSCCQAHPSMTGMKLNFIWFVQCQCHNFSFSEAALSELDEGLLWKFANVHIATGEVNNDILILKYMVHFSLLS